MLAPLLVAGDGSVDLCTAYATAVPAVASAQLPLFTVWRAEVEGDVGMPEWVHRAAGASEVLIVALRLLAHTVGLPQPPGGGAGYSAADGERLSALAHVLTCSIMGGAFTTWLLRAKDPPGVVPAALLLAASMCGR